MRARLAAASLVALSLVLGAGSVSAQPSETPSEEKPAPPKKKKKEPKEAPKSSAPVRRDPEGKTGISPYMELVAKGEAAFVAKDLPGAEEAFQSALKLDGQKMLAYYRLGEVQLAGGKMDDADATWQAGLTKKGPDDLNAKLLFVLADLRERQAKWQAGKDAWAAYAAFLQNNVKARGYPATPGERQKQADRRMKDEKEYGAVKERIAKRQAEKEAEAIENAKKDKLNR